MLDISNYLKNGYTVKIEQYVLVNDDGDELVIQVDHKQSPKINSNTLIGQLQRAKSQKET